MKKKKKRGEKEVKCVREMERSGELGISAPPRVGYVMFKKKNPDVP
jgi:hypothetical protein